MYVAMCEYMEIYVMIFPYRTYLTQDQCLCIELLFNTRSMPSYQIPVSHASNM